MSRGALKTLLFGAAAFCGGAVQLQGLQVPAAANDSKDESVSSRNASLVLPPVMMFAHGCSMTTAGVSTMRALLEAHGITPALIGNGELIKDLYETTSVEKLTKKTWGSFGTYYVKAIIDKKNLTDKFRIVHEWSQSFHKTMVFKSEYVIMYDKPDLLNYLKTVGTKAYFFKRENLIDVMQCLVHDFGGKDAPGLNVDEHGNEVEVPWRGRGATEADNINLGKVVPSKVWLDPTQIVAYMDFMDARDDMHMKLLQEYSLNTMPRPVSAEKLFAFETGDMAESIEEWFALLSSFGITPDRKLISHTLSQYGTFPAPKNHTETLYAFKELEAALQGTKYHDMLRY
jgi:hypothetical protein